MRGICIEKKGHSHKKGLFLVGLMTGFSFVFKIKGPNESLHYDMQAERQISMDSKQQQFTQTSKFDTSDMCGLLSSV